jgi:hypothetical protein
LNVIEVKVAEKDVGSNRAVAEFLLEFFTEEANSRASVEDQDLIAVRADFNAGGISSKSHVVFLGCWSRTTNSPEPHAHEPPPEDAAV